MRGHQSRAGAGGGRPRGGLPAVAGYREIGLICRRISGGLPRTGRMFALFSGLNQAEFMTQENQIRPSEGLRHVKYEIRGRLARRAQELERQGYEIVPLNIGNPGAFGFRTPETMRLAMIENMAVAEGYCHQKGIFPAREAVVMQQQMRGVTGMSAEEVFIGNGVSELIDLCLRALLNDGDEVLIPSPDYPLWSAAVTLNGGKAVYYPCRPENDFVPDPEEIAKLVTRKTRAIVVINPNNPTGAVYSREVCERIAQPGRSEEAGRVLRRDLRPDDLRRHRARARWPRWSATPCAAPCPACPRSTAPAAIAWAGRRSPATCAAPATIYPRSNCCPRCACARTCRRSGPCRPRSAATRASRNCSRRAGACTSPAAPSSMRRAPASFLHLAPPKGSMYAFVRVKTDEMPDFDDQTFALDLLEQKHVLLAPGTSFNVPYRDHFRTTLLPEAALLKKVFARIDELLAAYASRTAGDNRASCTPSRASSSVLERRKLLNSNRLPTPVYDGLAAGATLLCASAQRQAALRAAWAEQQRASGQALWQTPRVFTFTQFAERPLNESWAERQSTRSTAATRRGMGGAARMAPGSGRRRRSARLAATGAHAGRLAHRRVRRARLARFARSRTAAGRRWPRSMNWRRRAAQAFACLAGGDSRPRATLVGRRHFRLAGRVTGDAATLARHAASSRWPRTHPWRSPRGRR